MKNLIANKYVKLVESVPDKILANSGAKPDGAAKGKINNIISKGSEIFCELGSGSGEHLIELAGNKPDAFFLGFELRYKRAFRTVEKALKEQLQNIYIMRADARLLREYFPKASISGVYMNFPDPWERKRWQKHRMFGKQLLSDLSLVLKPNGFFAFKSDHKDLYREALEAVKSSRLFIIKESTEDLYASEFIKQNVKTEFERLFLAKQQAILYFKLCKEAPLSKSLSRTY